MAANKNDKNSPVGRLQEKMREVKEQVKRNRDRLKEEFLKERANREKKPENERKIARPKTPEVDL